MQQSTGPIVVKKYSNRRLYDTNASRYITLDELANTVRSGRDVRVIDAKTEADLTPGTLAQIIFEGRKGARLLPAQVLHQLVRMEDDALADFFGRWLSWALEIYSYGQKSAKLMPFHPFAAMPFGAVSTMARWFGAGAGDAPPPPPSAPPPPMPPPADVSPAAPGTDASDIAALRREIAELRASLTRSPTDPEQ